MSPFDFIKSINAGNNIMKDSIAEHEYNPFITNIAFSMFADSIFQANEMNKNPQLSNYAQYKYYLSSVKPKKRFRPWPKKDKINGENIRLIQSIYKYNVSKAKQVLLALTDDQIEWLKKQQEKGG